MLISLRLGELCNKNCTYCDYNEIKPKEINLKLFEEKLNFVGDFINKNNFDYSITGGEPGLINTEIFNSVFSKLKNKCIITTNGLFIEKDYHVIFDKNISEIYYHCIDEINSDILIEKINNDKIKYLIVVHADNITKLPIFLNNNKHITFDIKLVEQRSEKIPPLLSLENLYNLLDIVSANKNINKNIISNLSSYIHLIEDDEIYNIRITCSKKCFTPQIDFVHNVIRKCYKSYTHFPTIELTEENLSKTIKYQIEEFDKFNSICNECTYIYNFRNINSILISRHRLSRSI